jgi:hypothetical protein
MNMTDNDLIMWIKQDVDRLKAQVDRLEKVASKIENMDTVRPCGYFKAHIDEHRITNERAWGIGTKLFFTILGSGGVGALVAAIIQGLKN